jgi:hypothetical protein
MGAVTDIQSGPSDRRSNGLTFWSWLRSVLRPGEADNRCGRDPLAVVTAPSLIPVGSSSDRDESSATASARDQGSAAAGGVVLPFPIHGEALLVKLADVLRSRIADLGHEQDPLLLQMSRGPRSRLSIDRSAYIEFYQDRSEYRAVIEASLGTKVILETSHFDALVDFVLPYIMERLAKPSMPEPAP